ncbi:SPOR domain-containing protein [Sessilibacter corallicola]|uniref:SPOR domain-containing protein n=1 Tax=Sessilibacter corallicola TaxID=2904075 RepID=UPI001E6460C2|nr:SPOR domain-containing protein [Sessilibacter corallicola]MCE2026906.1 SPOR domain-containing protein [Sessilibacter corallicola]
MDNGVKQRLIGACVLVSVGIIFLPTLLHKESPQIVDTQTQVPVAPAFEFKSVESPTEPTNTAPLIEPDEMFQAVSDSKADQVTSSESPQKKPDSSTHAESFDNRGLPKAWVVQVGSFSEIERAKKFSGDLRNNGYKAFHREHKNNSKTVYRVYVGPNINRDASEKLKSELDLQFSVNSLVLRYTP